MRISTWFGGIKRSVSTANVIRLTATGPKTIWGWDISLSGKGRSSLRHPFSLLINMFHPPHLKLKDFWQRFFLNHLATTLQLQHTAGFWVKIIFNISSEYLLKVCKFCRFCWLDTGFHSTSYLVTSLPQNKEFKLSNFKSNSFLPRGRNKPLFCLLYYVLLFDTCQKPQTYPLVSSWTRLSYPLSWDLSNYYSWITPISRLTLEILLVLVKFERNGKSMAVWMNRTVRQRTGRNLPIPSRKQNGSCLPLSFYPLYYLLLQNTR